MDYLTVIVFRITSVPGLDESHLRETEPRYAAAIPGEDRYYCSSNRIENLGLELSLVSYRRNQRIIPYNSETESSRRFRFAQQQKVKREPLSPQEWELFVSASLYELGHWYKECLNLWEELKETKTELVELKQSGRKQLTEELPEDYWWPK